MYVVHSRSVTFPTPCSRSPADRHCAATKEVQKEEEKKFKEVGEAFTVLSDSKKKGRYDSGHDLDDDGGCGGGGGQTFSSIIPRECWVGATIAPLI